VSKSLSMSQSIVFTIPISNSMPAGCHSRHDCLLVASVTMAQSLVPEAVYIDFLRHLSETVHDQEPVVLVLRGSLLLRNWFGEGARPAADIDLECFERVRGTRGDAIRPRFTSLVDNARGSCCFAAEASHGYPRTAVKNTGTHGAASCVSSPSSTFARANYPGSNSRAHAQHCKPSFAKRPNLGSISCSERRHVFEKLGSASRTALLKKMLGILNPHPAGR
jgi:hypothetical protein